MIFCQRCRCHPPEVMLHGMYLCLPCARDGAHAIGKHYVGAAACPAPVATATTAPTCDKFASFIPGIVTGSMANQKRHDLGIAVTNLQNDISKCPAVPSDLRSRWDAWGQDSFVPWFNKCQGFVGAQSDLQAGLQLQGELRAFQLEVQQYCKVTGGLVTDPSAPAPGSIGQATQTISQGIAKTASSLGTLAWVMGIGALAGGLWLGYRALAAEKAMGQLATHLPT